MIDMGADAVICCHAHCPLPWEIHSNRPIIYGMGNLIFEAFGQEPDAWYQGYMARLTVENGQVRFEAIPYFQSQTHTGVKKMNEDARKSFFSEMGEKNDRLKNSAFLEGQWAKYCREQKDTHLAMLFGYNKIMVRMKTLLLRTLHSKTNRLCALNLVQCETHHEILNSIFKDERGEG